MPSYQGTRINTITTIHTGAGKLHGYMVSHQESTSQEITFYDSLSAGGTIIHKMYIAPEACPVSVEFPDPVDFSIGLTINPGNCELAIWAFGN